MTASANLDITHMEEGQSGGEVLFNEGVNRLDAIALPVAQDKDLTAPPGGESDGEMWIVGASATGDWATHDDALAIYVSGWLFVTPQEGAMVYLKDENVFYVFDGSDWALWGGLEKLVLSGTGAPVLSVTGTGDPIVSVTRTGRNGSGASTVSVVATDAKTASDIVYLDFIALDSADNSTDYLKVGVRIDDSTTTTEDSSLIIQLMKAGSLGIAFIVTSTGQITVDGTVIRDTSGFGLMTATDGITASTTQSQGQMPLTTEINRISVCANANDVVTLPSCATGRRCFVVNRGDQVLQVFPASGDNIQGTGVDSSVTVAAGARLILYGIDSTDWE